MTWTETDRMQIVAYCCEHCAYAAADLAGGLRMQYPPEIKVVMIPCTGKLDILMVLQAIENGADGVLITGCHIGDCHYQSGNKKAQGMVENLKEILSTLGIGDNRLRLEWISASEGNRFADVVTDFIKEIEGMGPNPMTPSAPEAGK